MRNNTRECFRIDWVCTHGCGRAVKADFALARARVAHGRDRTVKAGRARQLRGRRRGDRAIIARAAAARTLRARRARWTVRAGRARVRIGQH